MIGILSLPTCVVNEICNVATSHWIDETQRTLLVEEEAKCAQDALFDYSQFIVKYGFATVRVDLAVHQMPSLQ